MARNIVLVTANFRPSVGGIERFTEILGTGLVERGHRVSVICCQCGGAPRQEDAGFAIERIPASDLLHRRVNVPFPMPSPVALYRTISRHLVEADVVHVQEALSATSAAALLVARRRALPAVLTQHVGFVPQRTSVLDAVERVALATVGRCAYMADVVATMNPSVADWAKRRWTGLDVRVLPFGIPRVPDSGDQRGVLRRSFGLPVDRFLVLFVGRDVRVKGLDIFLGAGDAAYDLVAVTNRVARHPGATIIPFMPPDRLAELLACVDAFVLPSESEGFPLSLQEALAHGLPVVTTRLPGYERFLSTSDVLYVDRDPISVRAALMRLQGDPQLQHRLAGRSSEVAKRHFGLDGFVEAYESLYEEVIAAR